MNVWVAPAGDWRAARAVTSDTTEGVHHYYWAYTNDHILYLQDRAGDEDWRLYSVDVNSLERRALTPLEGVRAQVQQLSPEFPGQLLAGLNDRVPEFHDIYRVDLATGERRLVMENPGELGGGSVTGFVTDPSFRVRFARVMLPGGGVRLMQPGPDSTWEEFESIPQEDVLTTRLANFGRGGADGLLDRLAGTQHRGPCFRTTSRPERNTCWPKTPSPTRVTCSTTPHAAP